VRNKALAFFLAFDFDDADSLAVDEEHVVGRAGIGVPFAYGTPMPVLKSIFFSPSRQRHVTGHR